MIVLDAGEPVTVECPGCDGDGNATTFYEKCGLYDLGDCPLCHGEGVLDDVPLAEPVEVDGQALAEQMSNWRAY